ncbi:MAG: hypothetical protein NVV73_03325 [Cellvibrionaceae bacterium]|nr:hypothetical protein [Cellvibrionaceae bacterium]
MTTDAHSSAEESGARERQPQPGIDDARHVLDPLDIARSSSKGRLPCDREASVAPLTAGIVNSE